MNALKEKFNYLDSLIIFGKFTDFRENLKNWQNYIENSPIENMLISLLQAKFHNIKAAYIQGLDFSNTVLIESQKYKTKDITFYAIILKIWSLECLDNIEDAFDQIKLGNKILNLFQNDKILDKNLLFDMELLKAKFFIRCGTIYQKNYQYDKSLAIHSESFKIFQKKKKKLEMAEVLYNIGLNCSLTRQFTLTQFYFDESLKISKFFKKNMITSWALLHKSMAIYQNGKKKELIESITESLKISRLFNNRHSEDYAYLIASIYYSQLDNLKLAMKYQLKSHKLRKTRNNQLEIAYSYCTIANYYLRQSNAKKAYDTIEKVKIDLNQKKNSLLASLYYSTKGEILAVLGNFIESTINIHKALNIFENTNVFIQRLRCYHFLICIAIIQNKQVEVNKFLSKIENMTRKYPNHMIIHLYYQLEQAIIYKNSRDTYKELLAFNIFKKLNEEKIIYFHITTEIKINYLELLIKEYKITRNKAILDNILTIIEFIKDISELSSKVPLICELLCLKAKILSIFEKYDQTQDSYIIAQKIADDNGFPLQAQIISDTLDNFLSNIENMKERIKFLKKPQELDFSFIFSRIMHDYQYIQPNKEYVPLSLIVWKKIDQDLIKKNLYQNEDSISQFKITQSDLNHININSLNSILNKEFHRVNMKKFMVTTTHINNMFIQYCYIGSSYQAEKDVLSLIHFMTSLYQNLDNFFIHNKSNLSFDVELCVNDIFNKNYLE